ncbi:MAG: hypothetical protein WCS84_08880 [Nocardioides sp.]|jgi:hypothetical protein
MAYLNTTNLSDQRIAQSGWTTLGSSINMLGYRELVAFINVTGIQAGGWLDLKIMDGPGDGLWSDLYVFERIQANGVVPYRHPTTYPIGPNLIYAYKANLPVTFATYEYLKTRESTM